MTIIEKIEKIFNSLFIYFTILVVDNNWAKDIKYSNNKDKEIIKFEDKWIIAIFLI